MSTLAQAIGGQKRIVGGPFGSKLTTKDYTEHGIPVIRGSNMEINGRWIGGEYAYVSIEKFDRDLSTNIAHPGDIIVTQRGTLGQISIVPDDSEVPVFVVSQSQMAICVDPACADRNFVYYYLRSPEFVGHSQTQTIQTGVPHINLGILRDAPANFPPLPEQREIAAVLGALDDKIEMNRKTAATLEAMARALYRSWFVDFDPVWAKLESRAPAHMDPATAALFPDRFTEDGLPEGWESRGLDTIADFLNGAALQKFPATDGEDFLPVIKIAELRNGISVGSGRASASVPEKYKVHDGDILFSWSGSLLQKVWTGGVGALNQHLFKVTSEIVPSWFHYFAVDHHLPEFQAIAASKATTMGHIQRHHLSEAMVSLPPSGVLEAANKVLCPLFEAFFQREMESQTLATLRDSLLPRLMSGELRVPEARDAIEGGA